MDLKERASIEMLMILSERPWAPEAQWLGSKELATLLKERVGWRWGAGNLIGRNGGRALYLSRGSTNSTEWALSEAGRKRAAIERPAWRVRKLRESSREV
jgi:hypothetical protein